MFAAVRMDCFMPVRTKLRLVDTLEDANDLGPQWLIFEIDGAKLPDNETWLPRTGVNAKQCVYNHATESFQPPS